MRGLIAVFCLFTVTNCALENPLGPGPITQDVTLAPGQSAAVPGTDLSVTFDRVTGDDRCPANALCLVGESGSAAVTLEVRNGSGAPRDVTFETADPRPVEHDAFTLELVELQPYPSSAAPIRHDDYRATIHVSR